MAGREKKAKRKVEISSNISIIPRINRFKTDYQIVFFFLIWPHLLIKTYRSFG